MESTRAWAKVQNWLALSVISLTFQSYQSNELSQRACRTVRGKMSTQYMLFILVELKKSTQYMLSILVELMTYTRYVLSILV